MMLVVKSLVKYVETEIFWPSFGIGVPARQLFAENPLTKARPIGCNSYDILVTFEKNLQIGTHGLRWDMGASDFINTTHTV